MNRRDALAVAVKFTTLAIGGGILWQVGIRANDSLVLRPPGALKEAQFTSSCIRCGLCVEACPFDTLLLADAGSGYGAGLPYFIPRNQPCKMCPSIPCTKACPTNALDISLLINKEGKADINLSKMGVAVIDTKHCIAFWGINCDACYRACPLIDKAIKIEYRRNERTKRHAFLLPVVVNDVCTGCGMCERACITQKPSITILPTSVILGEVSDSYIKGWDKHDEKRMDIKNAKEISPNSIKDAQEYLNSGDEL